MIAELVLRPNDPHAAAVVIITCVVLIIAALFQIWYAWWTEWTCKGCGKAPRDCSCPPPTYGPPRYGR